MSVGYNGFPRGCSDEELPWARSAESRLDTKYMYVCHAEVNAVMNKNTASLKGARMYVALFPCNECAKIIIQSGIVEVSLVPATLSCRHSWRNEECRCQRVVAKCGCSRESAL